MLSHLMMLKNSSYCTSCKTFLTVLVSLPAQLCQEWPMFLALPSALIYSYDKAQRWKQMGTCRGSRHPVSNLRAKVLPFSEASASLQMAASAHHQLL